MVRHNKGGFVSGVRQPLSIVEEDFLRLFTTERLSLRLAAYRRGCSLQNARKYRKKLIEKGYMDARYNLVALSGCSTKPLYGNLWTLHGLEYHVKILSGQHLERYVKARGNAQGVISVRGSTVMLFDDVLKIKVGQVFESEHPETAAWRASEYLFTVLRVLENDLGVLLLKDRSENVQRVRGEFSRMNDEIALKPGAAQIKVFSGDDGKIRFKVDWSPGSMPEAEFLHSRHGQGDAVKYEDFLRDLVEKNSLKLSEVSALAAENLRQHNELALQVNQIATALKATLDIQASLLPHKPEVVEDDRRFFDYVG